MKEFAFNYAVQSTHISVSGSSVKVKQGFRTTEFQISEMKFFYSEKMSYGDFEECIVQLLDAKGKIRNVKIYSDLGAPGFVEFLQFLSETIPSGDLRSLDRKEAFEKLKLGNYQFVPLVALAGIINLVMIVLLSPLFFHGIDKGSAIVTAKELLGGNLTGTYNLTIKGGALSEGMEEKTTKKGRTTTKLFFPLVDDSWNSGDPIHILVQTGDLSEEELEAVLGRTEFQGVLRDFLWEGVSSSVKDFFVKEYGATFQEPVLLLELDADSSNDIFFFVGILLFVELIIAGLVIYTLRKNR